MCVIVYERIIYDKVLGHSLKGSDRHTYTMGRQASLNYLLMSMCCGYIRHDKLHVMYGDYVYQNEVIQIKDGSRNNFKVLVLSHTLVKYLSSTV